MGPKRLGHSPQMKRWLKEQVRSGECAILHNHSLWMMPNIYPVCALKNQKNWNNIPTKLIVSPRGTLSPIALAQSGILKKICSPLLLKPVTDNAHAFHATSEQEYHDIRKLGLRQPVAIIPNGIDVGKTRPGKNQILSPIIISWPYSPDKRHSRFAACLGRDTIEPSRLAIDYCGAPTR